MHTGSLYIGLRHLQLLLPKITRAWVILRSRALDINDMLVSFTVDTHHLSFDAYIFFKIAFLLSFCLKGLVDSNMDTLFSIR